STRCVHDMNRIIVPAPLHHVHVIGKCVIGNAAFVGCARAPGGGNVRSQWVSGCGAPKRRKVVGLTEGIGKKNCRAKQSRAKKKELLHKSCRRYDPGKFILSNTNKKRSQLDWPPHRSRQGVFKYGSRRREEADFGAKNNSASLPPPVCVRRTGRRLRLLRRFVN